MHACVEQFPEVKAIFDLLYKLWFLELGLEGQWTRHKHHIYRDVLQYGMDKIWFPQILFNINYSDLNSNLDIKKRMHHVLTNLTITTFVFFLTKLLHLLIQVISVGNRDDRTHNRGKSRTTWVTNQHYPPNQRRGPITVYKLSLQAHTSPSKKALACKPLHFAY